MGENFDRESHLLSRRKVLFQDTLTWLQAISLNKFVSCNKINYFLFLKSTSGNLQQDLNNDLSRMRITCVDF